MNNFERLQKIMDNPNKKYGIYPIIHDNVLNDKLIDQYENDGFAGIVGNVRYRPGFDKNEAMWRQTADNIREYIRRGMHVWIYDEDGYPSGSAGGYLTEEYPEYISKGLYCYEFLRVVQGPSFFRSDIPDGKLYKAVLFSDETGDIIDVSDSLNERNVLYIDVPNGRYRLIIMTIRRLFDKVHCSESYAAPRNYINLSNKAATDKFIEMTHEHYKKYLSDEFGKGIIASFTDEPSLISWHIDNHGSYPYLTWQEDFPQNFRKKYGYDFLLACIAVLKENSKDVIKRRCDYWEFMADAVADGYFKPIREWCKKNNLKSSGHLLSEEALGFHVLAYGSFYRSVKQLDYPGIDMLDTMPERMSDERNLPFARLVASIADISGENETFTEFSDHTVRGENGFAGKECYYASVNWHIAMGINNFTSYYSFSGFTSEDKQQLNVYTARCGELMRLGIRNSRTALFYPEADMWAAFNVQAEEAWNAGGEKFNRLRKEYNALSWELLFRQTDFDYIDSDIILNGTINNGKLCYNNRCYENIVFPIFHVTEDATAKKIIELAQAGAKIYILRGMSEISRETGKKSPYADKFKELINAGKIKGNNDGNVENLLDGDFGILKTAHRQKNLLTHCRVTEDDTTIIFAANMSREKLSDTLSVSASCSAAYEITPDDGKIKKIDFSKSNNNTTFDINIDGVKAKIYVLEK